MNYYRIRFRSTDKYADRALLATMQRIGGELVLAEVQRGPAWSDYSIIVLTDHDGYHLNEAISAEVQQGFYPGLLSDITVADHAVYEGEIVLDPGDSIFKFRAEAPEDVHKLMTLLPKGMLLSIKRQHLQWPEGGDMPDLEVTMTLAPGYGITDLMAYMLEVEDSHVMVDTLATERNYTGERDYLGT